MKMSKPKNQQKMAATATTATGDDSVPKARDPCTREIFWRYAVAPPTKCSRCLLFACAGRRARQKWTEIVFSDTVSSECHWYISREGIKGNLSRKHIAHRLGSHMSSSSSGGVVGGHAEAFKKGPNGFLLKEVEPTELAFYEAAHEGLWPLNFLPDFNGTITDSDGERHLVLGDLTTGFKRPCILDLKMGLETVLDDAALPKRLGMTLVDSVTGSSTQGVRLVGMRLYQPYTRTQFKADKKMGLQIGVGHTIAEVLAFFFDDGQRVRAELIEAVYLKVRELLS